jgi:hypothetical protein
MPHLTEAQCDKSIAVFNIMQAFHSYIYLNPNPGKFAAILFRNFHDQRNFLLFHEDGDTFEDTLAQTVSDITEFLYTNENEFKTHSNIHVGEVGLAITSTCELLENLLTTRV